MLFGTAASPTLWREMEDMVTGVGELPRSPATPSSSLRPDSPVFSPGQRWFGTSDLDKNILEA